MDNPQPPNGDLPQPAIDCPHCQPLNFPCTNSDFLRAHNFESHWTTEQPESEESRYRSIEEWYNSTFVTNYAEQIYYVVCRDLILAGIIPHSIFTPAQQQLLESNCQEIKRFGLQRDQSWKTTLTQYVDDKQDTSHVTKLAKIEYPSSPDVIIRVIRSICMFAGRYYLGHSPGTYIFQYRSPPVGGGAGSGEYMGWLGVDQVTERNFEYVGQIPRHPDEHGCRLLQLLKPVMTLFISALQLHIGRRHSSTCPELDELLSRPTIDSATQFASVWECWSQYSQQPTWPNRQTQRAFAHRPIIQELAWLMHHLRIPRQCSAKEPPTPLQQLLVAAAGESLESLQCKWHVRCEKTAWAKLRSGNRQGLFVYEVAPETINIFEFYKRDAFANDLYNPRMKHAFPDLEVLRVREPYDQLITDEVNRLGLLKTT